MSVDYLLHESGAGYSIFQVTMQPDTIGARLKEVQQKANDLATFGKMVKVVGYSPFQNASQAFANQNDISEGIVSDFLRATLEANLPKPGKKSKITLAVCDRALAGAIKALFPGIECETPDTSVIAADLLRGIRQHETKLLGQLKNNRVQEGDVERGALGLAHSYSRAKVKFSVNRNDQHIIQSIATLDQLDKAVNTFSMRVREWYSWHFPELIRVVSDNHTFAKLVLFIGNKKTLSDDSLHDLAALVNDDKGIATNIIDAAKISMGQDLSEEDMLNVQAFARRVVSISAYRKNLSAYLAAKMGVVAPNLAALIGETVAARLISHAGSLTNLSKYPASTVQILGAEKALFRALKTKGNTPKYGLIYHSSFIGRAGMRNKGRISRFLANKCSIASRIDNFSEAPSTKFGEALRKQVEERLEFYASGATPRKNADVMAEVMNQVLDSINVDDGSGSAPGKSRVIVPPIAEDMEDIVPGDRSANALAAGEDQAAKKLAKREKKLMKEEKKKSKKRSHEADELAHQHHAPIETVASGKKKHLDSMDDSDSSSEAKQAEKKKKKKHKHKHGRD